MGRSAAVTFRVLGTPVTIGPSIVVGLAVLGVLSRFSGERAGRLGLLPALWPARSLRSRRQGSAAGLGLYSVAFVAVVFGLFNPNPYGGLLAEIRPGRRSGRSSE
jgi:hypothetical protein